VKKKAGLYAVITGDIVGSSKLTIKQRVHFLEVLKSSFTMIKKIFPGIMRSPFEIYRGDGFQGVLSQPEKALPAAIVIRINLRKVFEAQRRRKSLDARIAIGIGSIDFLPDGRSAEGDGEAFQLSGPVLDEMKGDRRLIIRTPQESIHEELDTECALLDPLINKWSNEQAQAILCQIRGLTQEKAAKELHISQPAVQLRLKEAGGWAIEVLLKRYSQLISQIISPGAYNGRL
jgi:predicted DNA-binding protein (UPF0251 family)